MELGQLQVACDLMRRYDGKEPEEILPAMLPTPVSFESNKDYVRDILASQLDLSANGLDYTADPPGRYDEYQRMVHDDADVASESVISEHVARFGKDYRIETEGPHPAERLRAEAVAGKGR
jgi:hypothetical protein